MLRFLHTADTHIDSPLLGLDAYEGAPVDALRGATRRAFEHLVQLALDEQVNFVLIAGDVYDGDWKDFSTGLFFTGQMARLHAAGIPVYLIAGNHDAASVLTRHLTLPENVRVFSTRAAETKEVPGLPVVVHGRGFPNRAVPENLVADYPEPVSGRFNIGLLHTSLTGSAGHDTYAPCSLRDLADKGYDYWALGHIHQPQLLQRDPWIIFPGNPQGRHINETGPRGCRLVTLSDSLEVLSAEHRSLDLVRWERIDVDVSGSEDAGEALTRIGKALEQGVAAAEGRLLAARIRLTGSTDLHGHFKRALPWLRAECIARGQLIGGDALWIESVRVATTPRYDPVELAERDDLTRILLDSLAAAGVGDLALPDAAAEMIERLPAELQSPLKQALQGDARLPLLQDVQAILLEALARRGGEK